MVVAVAFVVFAATSVLAQPGAPQLVGETKAPPGAGHRLPEPDTIEYKQFKALLSNPRDREGDDRWRRVDLEHLGVPADMRSFDAVRAGAKQYAQQRWLEIHEARRRDAALDDVAMLQHAWIRHVGQEDRLYRDAVKRLRFAELEVRAEPVAEHCARVRRELEGSLGVRDGYRLLLQALLIPADERLADAIVTHALKLAKAEAKQPASRRPDHWEWVCMSPDPAIQAAVVAVICAPEAAGQAETICQSLFRMSLRKPCWPITTTQMRRIVECAPPDGLASILEAHGKVLMRRTPVLKEMLSEGSLPAPVRVAIAAAVATDISMRGENIFTTAVRKNDHSLVRAILAECLRPGNKSRPSVLELERLIAAPETPEEQGVLAVRVLGRWAHHSRGQGEHARELLERLAAGEEDSHLAVAARGVLEDLEQREARKAELKRGRFRVDKEYYTAFREGIEEAERKGVELDRHLVYFFRIQHYMLARQEIQDSLTELLAVARERDGALPGSLDEITRASDVITGVKLRYFPRVSLRLNQIPGEVILLMSQSSVDKTVSGTSDPEFVVLVGLASGNIEACTRAAFPEVWRRSNQALDQVGERAIDPSALGELEAWSYPPEDLQD